MNDERKAELRDRYLTTGDMAEALDDIDRLEEEVQKRVQQVNGLQSLVDDLLDLAKTAESLKKSWGD